MTTIAYRDGILAFDEQVTFGGTRWASLTKARQIGEFIIACTGSSSMCHAYLQWAEKNIEAVLTSLAPVQEWKQDAADRDFDALIIKACKVFSFDGSAFPYPVACVELIDNLLGDGVV